jgi:hypothetical protein
MGGMGGGNNYPMTGRARMGQTEGGLAGLKPRTKKPDTRSLLGLAA